MNFIKENIALGVGIALPVVFVLIFMALSTLPRALSAPPQYRPVFVTTTYQPDKNKKQRKIEKHIVYSFQDDSFTDIDAKKLTLDKNPAAPDGYTYRKIDGRQFGVADIFFGSHRDGRHRASRALYSYPIPLEKNRHYSATFAGWIAAE